MMETQSLNLIALLQAYLRIDTSHPRPAYEQAIIFFEQQALHDGFEKQRIILASGKPVLIIVQRGSNPALPALALTHHMDVVPAPDAEQWKHHPFAGTIEDNIIYGRGTQDMKAVGIVHYGALLALKQKNIELERTICLLLLPDEEIGGFTGAGMFVKTPEFKKLNIGYVIDEGLPSGDEQHLLIKVSERKPLQIRITATGAAAHGSRLMAHNGIHTLVSTLEKFVQMQQKQQRSNPHHPGNILSVNITSLVAGSSTALNVIPAQACATLDIRVPQHMTMTEAQTLIQAIIGTQCSLEILAQADDVHGTPNNIDSFYKVIEHAIIQNGLRCQRYYAEEASDLRFYRNEGITGLGFSPFTITPNLHGTNESIRIHDIEIGLRIMTTLLQNFCTEQYYV